MTTDMATNVAKRLGLLAFNKKNPAFIAFGGGFLEHQPWYSGPRDPGGWRERLAWAAAYLELSDRLCGLLGLPLEPEEVASVQLCPCAGDEGCEQAEWDIATKGGGVFDLNDDGVIDEKDFAKTNQGTLPPSGFGSDKLLTRPNILGGPGGVDVVHSSDSSGDVTRFNIKGSGELVGRHSWRQLR